MDLGFIAMLFMLDFYSGNFAGIRPNPSLQFATSYTTVSFYPPLKPPFLPKPSTTSSNPILLEPKTPLFSPFSPFSELENELGFALDLLNLNPFDLSLQCFFPPLHPSHFEVLESAIDLIQIKKIQDRMEADFYLRNLSDRVSALELGFDRVLIPKINGQDRRYSLQAEVKGAEKDGIDRKYKWTVEIKGKGKNAPISRAYTLKASSAPAGGKPEKAKESKGKCSDATTLVEKGSGTTRVVEIEDTDLAGLAVKQVFARKRDAAVRTIKGKSKELSPQDAAMIIQVSFRAHLVHLSQTLRGLRDLAVAKVKLKELRALFTNFSYRRRIACDAEECQRFSEKIIVLLLTVDAIEDLTIRSSTSTKFLPSPHDSTKKKKKKKRRNSAEDLMTISHVGSRKRARRVN
ncbi:uncharacterized protein LOC143863315 [Tasmannia lanceolata]|uniref:uncharacterized protein LOC143863315 n=1 Tax=Tasmannia lanceolata TaxID=3420 RepID=UPI004064669E